MVVRIDGSVGEGGGQILRTSLAMAALLGCEIEVVNIRRGRKKPGLQPQHLTAVRAVRDVSRGKTMGDELGSEYLVFTPGKTYGGEYQFDVAKVQASAGSVSLVFQAVLPALLFAAKPTRLVLKGGTHVPWSPPTTYVEQVFLPALAKMNVRASMKTNKWGYYPQGGGIAEAEIEPVHTLAPIELTQRGSLVKITGAAVVSNLPESIAERECRRFLQRLAKKEMAAEIEINQSPSGGRGTCLMVTAEYEAAVAGFSSLGEIGKRAEVVADEVFDEFFAFHRSAAAVEKHLADQLVVYMALASGRSWLRVSEITDHLLTNIWVVEQFLPVKFEIVGEKGGPGSVSVEGIEYKPGLQVPSTLSSGHP